MITMGPTGPDRPRSKAGVWYDDQSRHVKRSVVGTSAVGSNLVLGWILHDILGLDVKLEVAMPIAAMVSGGIAWMFGGGIREMIVGYYYLKRDIDEMRRMARKAKKED